jgi:hypothetical protein
VGITQESGRVARLFLAEVVDGRAGRRPAIVTGAASGIGAAIADAFATEEARLVLADRDSERLEGVVRRRRRGRVDDNGVGRRSGRIINIANQLGIKGDESGKSGDVMP